MEVRGTAELEIHFGGCRWSVHVVVVNIGHGGILGMDTLKRWGASVDVGWGEVRLDPPCISREEVGEPPLGRKVLVLEENAPPRPSWESIPRVRSA